MSIYRPDLKVMLAEYYIKHIKHTIAMHVLYDIGNIGLFCL